MVKIELKGTEGPLFCFRCGMALITKNGFEPPCNHTLLLACEDGEIEYLAPDLDEEELQKKIDESSLDQATDGILGEKDIKFALYEGGPSNFAVYVAIRTDLPKKP